MMRTAFAGDGIEKALVQAVVKRLEIECIVETGTYTGKTSMWLGATFRDCEVYTSEVIPEMHQAAKRALARQRNVRPVLADSTPWIAALCRNDLRDRSTLFFLDAHGMAADWSLEHPLLAELRSVEQREALSIIIIDDFRVPARPDYAFLVNETNTSFAFAESERPYLDGALEMTLISGVLDEHDAVLYPDYTYEDALRYQADPAHNNLIGYVVLLHACSKTRLDAFLGDPLVRQHYRRER